MIVLVFAVVKCVHVGTDLLIVSFSLLFKLCFKLHIHVSNFNEQSGTKSEATFYKT